MITLTSDYIKRLSLYVIYYTTFLENVKEEEQNKTEKITSSKVEKKEERKPKINVKQNEDRESSSTRYLL